jgi:hypothetical protein
MCIGACWRGSTSMENDTAAVAKRRGSGGGTRRRVTRRRTRWRARRVTLFVVTAEPKNAGEADVRSWTPHNISVSGSRLSGYDWSPDGKRLVFAGTRTPAPDDWSTARLAIRDSAEPELMRSPAGAGPAEFSPLWSRVGPTWRVVGGDIRDPLAVRSWRPHSARLSSSTVPEKYAPVFFRTSCGLTRGRIEENLRQMAKPSVPIAPKKDGRSIGKSVSPRRCSGGAGCSGWRNRPFPAIDPG